MTIATTNRANLLKEKRCVAAIWKLLVINCRTEEVMRADVLVVVIVRVVLIVDMHRHAIRFDDRSRSSGEMCGHSFQQPSSVV